MMTGCVPNLEYLVFRGMRKPARGLEGLVLRAVVGPGQWFSAAFVALAVAAWFVRSLLRVIASRAQVVAAS